MKGIIVSGSVTLMLALMFVFGFATNTPALTAVAFCGWTPAILALGVAIGRARLRVVVTSDTVKSLPLDDVQPRVRRIS